ncbi:caspase a-like [Pempheris klunzingeri]|uniref:caspase a-like n=1 Tax=Pempheris klunzingeri TaxID=3127111 RepID=UPI00397F0DE4
MAAKELARVRVKFVDSVSTEVISQLLDDILEDGIVNDGERDAVLEAKSTRAERARCVIDLVKRKGDEASRKMIAHLRCRDETLYNELGLSSGQPAQPAAEPPAKQERSTTLNPTTDDDDIYPVTKESIGNRVALLITNIKFANEKFNRNGAEKDEMNMEKLLKDLGYEVVKYTDLTGKQIDAALMKFSGHPKLKATDSVVVVIMSHGKQGAVLGVNHKHETSGDDEFPIDNIYKHLGSEKCPALLNKPKIIIIQACRGEDRGSVLVCDSGNSAVVCDDVDQPGPSSPVNEENIDDDTVRCVHREIHFFPLLSCTPGTVSYRQTDRGSLLIQFIVEVFNKFAKKDDIDELFRKVMRRFEKFSISNKRQMATKDRYSATRRFYFFPNQ